MTQTYVKNLMENNQLGNIIFISSETGDTADCRPYGYTKTAINSMVQGLAYLFKNNGISVSFNGNEYPLKVAEIAVVSPSAITTAVLANIYANNDKTKVIEFINDYNNLDNYEELFEKYNIDNEIKERFFAVFNDKQYPLIQIINEDNFDEILKYSKEMRNTIRGQDIGELG